MPPLSPSLNTTSPPPTMITTLDTISPSNISDLTSSITTFVTNILTATGSFFSHLYTSILNALAVISHGIYLGLLYTLYAIIGFIVFSVTCYILVEHGLSIWTVLRGLCASVYEDYYPSEMAVALAAQRRRHHNNTHHDYRLSPEIGEVSETTCLVREGHFTTGNGGEYFRDSTKITKTVDAGSECERGVFQQDRVWVQGSGYGAVSVGWVREARTFERVGRFVTG